MAGETLMFDLLAKDSASSAFSAMARSAALAAGEMHAAFAEPIEAKIKTEGFDEYMAKLAEMRASNDLALGDIHAKTMKLVEGADQAGRELDDMASKMDAAGSSAERAGGRFSRFFDILRGGRGAGGGKGGKSGGGGGGGFGMAAGLLATPPALVGIGGAASMLTSAAGAGGILGLSVFGQIKGYADLEKKITSLKTSLAGMSSTSKSYAADQAKLNGLLATQKQQYGPLVSGIGLVSSAWKGFLNQTKGPDMKLFGEVLKIAADALRQFAPVSNAVAKALFPLLKQMDAWVKGGQFKSMMTWLATSGAKGLADLAHFLGEAVKGFLDLMQALAPVGDAMGKFLGKLGERSSLAILGTIIAGVVIAMTGLGGALVGVSGTALLVAAAAAAIGTALVYAWTHSETFRQTAVTAFAQVKSAVSDLVTAAAGFWARWGKDIETLAVNVLIPAVRQIGDVLAGLAHIIAAILDAVSGNWSGAWKQMKEAAARIWDAIKSGISSAVHAVEAILSAAWHGIEFVAAAAWHGIESLVSSAWHGIASAVSSGIGHVVSFMKSLPGKMVAAVGNLGHLLWSAGEDLVKGLIGGIGAMIGSALAMAKSLAGKIGGAFKGAVGIRSPSTVFHGYGQNVVQGLINGIQSKRTALHGVVAGLGQSLNGWWHWPNPSGAGNSAVSPATSLARAIKDLQAEIAAQTKALHVTGKGALKGNVRTQATYHNAALSKQLSQLTSLQSAVKAFSLASVLPATAANPKNPIWTGVKAQLDKLQTSVIKAGGAWTGAMQDNAHHMLAQALNLDVLTRKGKDLASALTAQQQATTALQATMKQFGDSVVANFTTGLFGQPSATGTGTTAATAASVIASLTSDTSNINAFGKAFSTLAAEGLSKTILSQLGSTGDLASALSLASASPADIAGIDAAEATRQAALTGLSSTTTGDVYGAQMAAQLASQKSAQAAVNANTKAISTLVATLEREATRTKNETIEVYLDGSKVGDKVYHHVVRKSQQAQRHNGTSGIKT